MITKITNALWIVVVLFLFFGSLWLIRNGELQAIVAGLGLWAPTILILLKISTLVVAPLGGTPIYLVAGAIYGNWTGLTIVLVGDVLGSSICFLISKKYGERVVRMLASDKFIVQIKEAVRVLDNASSFTKARFGAMIMPELLAYAAGLSRINFWKFTFINFLFYIPVDVVYVFFGTQLRVLSAKYFFVMPVILGIIILIGFTMLYKDYEKLEEGN